MHADHFPTEEEQFTAYKTVLEQWQGKPEPSVYLQFSTAQIRPLFGRQAQLSTPRCLAACALQVCSYASFLCVETLGQPE